MNLADASVVVLAERLGNLLAVSKVVMLECVKVVKLADDSVACSAGS